MTRWIISKRGHNHHVITRNGGRFAVVADVHGTDAEAQLIAAAPELLAALKGMLDLTHQCGEDCVMSEPCPIGEQAREAIAKANVNYPKH